MVKATVVATFLNEQTTIERFIQALLTQSIIPDEIVLVDGGSSDRTIEIVNKSIKSGTPIKLVVKRGNRSVGRNEGIRQARNDVLIVTDAGTVADKNWYERITRPFEDPAVKTVAGFFKAAPESFFEKVSSILMLADHDNINPETWLPSTRSIAFRREAWEKVGGFPEHTRYNEDTPFDIAIKEAGYKFYFVQDAFVFWRPRGDLKSFFKQYHEYSIGDGLDLIHLTHYIRKTCLYLAGLVVFLIGLRLYPVFWVWLILVLAYFFRRDIRVIRKVPSPKTVLLAPILTLTYDLAEISGFIKGVLRKNEKGN